MTEFSEDRVYARHRRRTGAVLVIGAGAVGGLTAQQLAPMGFSPIWLLDYDVLEVENIIRHPLGAEDVGQPKARALARHLRRQIPGCNAIGIVADFTRLSPGEQLRLVRAADVVVAATDSVDCQRRVNQVCLQAERPAVYPAVWVDRRIRDAEVGEILWVLPGRHTPCYECAVAFRQATPDAQAARGARVDIELVALATAQVVAALLDPTDERSGILDPERTAIYIHGLTPTSPGIRRTFAGAGLQSRNVRVSFPPRPCPACGAWDGDPRGDARPAPATPVEWWRRLNERQRWTAGWALAAAILLIILLIILVPVHHTSPSAANAGALPAPAGGSSSPSSQPTTSGPESASASSSSSASGGSADASASSSGGVSSSPTDSGSGSPSGGGISPTASDSGSSLNPDGFALPMTAPPGNPSLTDACQQEYNDSNAAAVDIPGSDLVASYTVQCLDGSTDLGGLNLGAYCDNLAGMQSYNPDRYGDAADQPPPWQQWECVPS